MFSALGDKKMGQTPLCFQYVPSFANLRIFPAQGQYGVKKSGAI
jgi:hypothetical protein